MKRLTFIIMILVTSFSYANDKTINCDAMSNEELTICNRSRYQQIDNKLNKLYTEKHHQLNHDNKKMLLASQRLWITFKEQYCAFIYDSIYPGQEAEIEKNICLWKITDDRVREISRINQLNINDPFLNTINSLESIGYPRKEIAEKIEKKIKNIEESMNDFNEKNIKKSTWFDYVESNCNLMNILHKEDYDLCQLRVNLQRADN